MSCPYQMIPGGSSRLAPMAYWRPLRAILPALTAISALACRSREMFVLSIRSLPSRQFFPDLVLCCSFPPCGTFSLFPALQAWWAKTPRRSHYCAAAEGRVLASDQVGAGVGGEGSCVP